MEACTLVSVKIPKYMNELKFAGCNLNPVVVLTDCTKVKKTTPPAKTPTSAQAHNNEEKRSETPGEGAEEDSLGANTQTGNNATPGRFRALKRKRNSLSEYEIERIVGYHRNKQGKMWYLIKWKGWSEEHNTFEPIDNLTGCHYKLMKYFEIEAPTPESLREKDGEVTKSARKKELYEKLRRRECTGEEIEAFCRMFPQKVTRDLFEMKDPMQVGRHAEEEYWYIVRCLIGMRFHQDAGLVERAAKYKLLLMLMQERRKQLENLKAAEKEINNLEETKVRIVNEVDLEEFPDLDYIIEMRPGKDVFLPREAVLGCECKECKPKSQCCGKLADSVFAYCPDGRLRTSSRVAIYECNSRCKCPPTCQNRVVQHGRRVKLSIFKTRNCGWGVRAGEVIPRGAFVCEYIGEVIPDSEANIRDVEYLKNGKSGYMFDLDFFTDSNVDMYCIDATQQGNLARFINHSCDPNLVVYPVWVDCLAPNIHRLAFFARRRIREGEEIHFDYENLQDVSELQTDDGSKGYTMRMVSSVRCHCNSPNCRNWVFGNK